MADRCKYQKLQYQVSYNNGSTWENVTPIQVKKGDVIEYMSRDCSEIETLYRWVDLDGTYLCDGNNKYTRQIQEESYDNGVSWYASYPTVYQRGTFVGADEEYCADKFVGHYVNAEEDGKCPSQWIWNGETCVYIDPLKVVKCNNSGVLTSGETSYYSSSITNKAFRLVSCEIGNCVTSIGSYAFGYESFLNGCKIPNTVTSIGDNAFTGCALLTSIGEYGTNTSVEIPNTVTSIGEGVFSVCRGLTNVIVPDSVTSIGAHAFTGCTSLTSATLSVGGNDSTLAACTNLKYVRVKGGTIPYYFAAASPIETLVIDNGVTSIGQEAFEFCSGLTNVTVPDSVTSIGQYAFLRCYNLTSVTIGNGITNINLGAFSFCSGLTSIEINNSTPPTLGYEALRDTNNCPIYVPCDSVNIYKANSNWSSFSDRIFGIPPCGEPPTYYKLQSVYSNGNSRNVACDGYNLTLSSATTKPNSSSYPYSAMTSAEIGECVSTIGDSAFSGCRSLTSITIPSSVTNIGKYAFEICRNLTSIDIPSGVTSISRGTFKNCSGFTSFTVPNTITSIGANAFEGCSGLTSFTFSSGITAINGNTLAYCTKIKNIDIPSGVTNIGVYAFHMCTGLTSIDIPSGVTSIGDSAFLMCSGLTSITINRTTPPSLDNYAFDNTNNCPIYVPSGSVNTYKSAWNSGYKNYANRIYAIGATKFRATYEGGTQYSIWCNSSTSITSAMTRPSGYIYTAMTKAEIGGCNTTIGENAFSGCTSLTSVTIPNSIRTLSTRSFSRCESLSSVTIPSSVTTIGGNAFTYCTSLEKIDVPNSVTVISGSAFQSCTSLTSVTIQTSTTTIGSHAFENCTSLNSVTVNRLTPPTLGNAAFDNTNNCPIYVPSSVVSTYKSASGWSTYASRIQAIP